MAIKIKTTNRSAIDRSISRTAAIVAEDFGLALQSRLTEEVRDYPRTTVRRVGAGKTGKIAGSPRDVVDTGDLVNSYEFQLQISPRILLAIYTWNVPHAAIVWAGTDKVPPYPWTRYASEIFDPVENFVENAPVDR